MTSFPVLVGQTKFPLKANHKAEHLSQKMNGEKDKYDYVVFDGPPYANGEPHLGHVLNKHLKDVLARSFAKKGDVMWWAGWDCHGLPVELAAQKENPDDPKYRMYAHKQVARQRGVFENQGWMLDTENMWTTMDPTYEAKTFSVFQKLFERGYVYMAHTAVPWCTHCKSTLANAEHEEGVTKKNKSRCSVFS